jgi:hypothetical protein
MFMIRRIAALSIFSLFRGVFVNYMYREFWVLPAEYNASYVFLYDIWICLPACLTQDFWNPVHVNL